MASHGVSHVARAGDDNAGGLCVAPDEGAGLGWDVLWIWPAAVAIAVVTWWPLGFDARSGLHGGDVYTYFFPLKAWYADRLAQGEVPLWNPLVGHGFPALGESQTGVFYPLNLVFYRLLPLNQAYHFLFVLHYVLGFGFSCHYARRLGLGVAGSLLAAVVFVYGWFPARSCLEWAIVTGAWIPLAFWGVEVFLRGGRISGLVAAQAALVMQLLAGHFHLAFITLLGLALYVAMRIEWRSGRAGRAWGQARWVASAMVLALGMAALQLVPSWELKERSQRESAEFDAQRVGYGRIPLSYLPQALLPWRYYPRVNEPEFDDRTFGRQNTNKVEAHLYFGLIALVWVGVGLGTQVFRWAGSEAWDRAGWAWVVIGVTALLLSVGGWVRWGAWLPGFGYFTGPGRYGVLVQMAVALWAGRGVDWTGGRIRAAQLRGPIVTSCVVAAGCVVVLLGWRGWTQWSGGATALGIGGVRVLGELVGTPVGLGMVVLLASVGVLLIWRRRVEVLALGLCVVLAWADLVLAVQAVQYAERRAAAPIHLRNDSLVGRLLGSLERHPRVLARNQNSVTLCGVSGVPVYLGIGPREYFSGPLRVPGEFHWQSTLPPTVRAWLVWSGVTHVVSFDPVDDESLELISFDYDPFLHDVLGRSPSQPLWIYSVRNARGRAYRVRRAETAAALDPDRGDEISFERVDEVQVAANSVELVVHCDEDSTVIVTDLMYPGWRVTVDGRRVPPELGGVFRAVAVPAGTHTVRWAYRPLSMYVGLCLSVLSCAVMGLLVGWKKTNPAARTRRNGGAGTEKRPTASGGHPHQSTGAPA